MVLRYYIQIQSMTGALEKRCCEICIRSTWQMPVDGFVLLQVTSVKPC